MRTHIDIDEELIAKAMAVTGLPTKKAAVEAGLRLLVRRHEQENATDARLETRVTDADILVGDIVLREVLQGARDDAHAARIERAMRRFPIVSMSNEALAVEAARHYRNLRDRGAAAQTIDLIIGSFCIANGYARLHDDRDFDPMERHLGLLVV